MTTYTYIAAIDILIIIGWLAVLLLLIGICLFIFNYLILRMMEYKRFRNILYYVFLRHEVKELSDSEYETLQLQMYELRLESKCEKG